eukprot:TRINITY_DN5202_c0_g1_i1.p1 TRINITY_DN5202_c0_g1~~TRINITY_DN5202_c0_g1_i1.p1  ORF type:complete len:357 (-),score=60.61 TRINITY_DN5202_c0_g1_i1:380-1450(-)
MRSNGKKQPRAIRRKKKSITARTKMPSQMLNCVVIPLSRDFTPSHSPNTTLKKGDYVTVLYVAIKTASGENMTIPITHLQVFPPKPTTPPPTVSPRSSPVSSSLDTIERNSTVYDDHFADILGALEDTETSHSASEDESKSASITTPHQITKESGAFASIENMIEHFEQHEKNVFPHDDDDVGGGTVSIHKGKLFSGPGKPLVESFLGTKTFWNRLKKHDERVSLVVSEPVLKRGLLFFTLIMKNKARIRNPDVICWLRIKQKVNASEWTTSDCKAKSVVGSGLEEDYRRRIAIAAPRDPIHVGSSTEQACAMYFILIQPTFKGPHSDMKMAVNVSELFGSIINWTITAVERIRRL